MRAVRKILGLVCASLFLQTIASIALCEDSAPPHKPLNIGYVGCLTSFAASYGKAALDGIQLAIEDARAAGTDVKLIVEDDQSETKNTVTAYRKLSSLNHIDGLITGSWWVNSIVPAVEHDKIPFISVETLFDHDTITAPNYFIMQGDLHEWVRAFEPLIEQNGWTRGATIRFSSGFGLTLAETMQELFSKPGRNYAGTIEYGDTQGGEIAGIALKLKQLNPEVVYIDAQPNSFATFVAKFRELGMTNLVVLSNQIVEDSISQKLIAPKIARPVFYCKRDTLNPDFARKFQARFGGELMLNADLAYFGMKLLLKALASANPVDYIKESGEFDRRNLFTKLRYGVWSYDLQGQPVEVIK